MILDLLICNEVRQHFNTLWLILGAFSQHYHTVREQDSCGLFVFRARSFASNLQLPFLIQQEEENGRICFFHDKISTKECTVWNDLTGDRPYARQVGIRPSCRSCLIGSIMTVNEICTTE